jgi:Ser/Thr protein kinase RdoA (MazF antagonist)
LARAAYALQQRLHAAYAAAAVLRSSPGADRAAIDAVAGGSAEDEAGNPPAAHERTFTTLRSVGEEVSALVVAVEGADGAPTADERAAWKTLRPQAERVLRAWNFVRRRATPAKASHG